MEKDLKDQEKGFTDDITSLNKKVRCHPEKIKGNTSDLSGATDQIFGETVQRSTIPVTRHCELLLHFVNLHPRLKSSSTSSIMHLSNNEVNPLYPFVLYSCNSYL